MATAKEIISIATKELGTKEFPSGSNRVKYNTWYYGKEVSGSAYPWCAVFVNWCFVKANASKLFYGGKKSAYCPTIENYYKSIGRYYGKTQGKAGDLCLMDFGKGRASHIGIVESKNTDGSYNVIEGNTSKSSNDNGGSVMKRVRRENVIRGFARPNYDSDKKITNNTITSTITSSKPTITTQSTNFKVKVTVSALNIRSGAGTNYKIADCIRDKGTYTITKTSGDWGYLKSGAGWINISSKYVKRV